MQFVLLFLCIKYWLRDRRAQRDKSSRSVSVSAHEPINSQDEERLLPSIVAGREAESLLASPLSFGSFANSPTPPSPSTNGANGAHDV